jgi:probable HAF family extracellular repeat protein
MDTLRAQGTSFAFAMASLGLLASGPTFAQQYYGVTEILPPSGSQYIIGYALNASGQITGYVDTHAQAISNGGAYNLAFITAPNGGALTPLAAPAGVTDANGFGINDAGQVAGSYSVGSTGLGFITAPNGGAPTLLPGPARGINATGQVTGGMLLGNGAFQAYLTGPNGMAATVIGALPGMTTSEGLAINSGGQVTGVSYNLVGFSSVDEHAFVYSKGVMTDLGTLPGDVSSIGNAINVIGQVAGYSSPDPNGGGNNVQAFVSAPGGGALTKIGFGEAFGINDAGDVVGAFGLTPSTVSASIYEDGSFFNLNKLLTGPLEYDVTLDAAFAINDSGDIVATGFDRRFPTLQDVTFLLTPGAAVPEPATLWLVCLGLAGIGFMGRRREN